MKMSNLNNFARIYALSMFLLVFMFFIHSLAFRLSSLRCATIAAVALMVYHTFMVTEAYHYAVQMRWSWASMRVLIQDGTHCVFFLIAAVDIIRDSGKSVCLLCLWREKGFNFPFKNPYEPSIGWKGR